MAKLLDMFTSKFSECFYLEEDDSYGRMPFGIPSLDVASGGGMLTGRIVELFGAQSSGKSTIALHHAKEVLSTGGAVVYMDCEYALDKDRLNNLGINQEAGNFMIGHPTNIEEMFDIIRESIEILRKKFSGSLLYVIDSIASLPPAAELKGSAQLNTQASAYNKEFRKTVSILSKNKVSLIGINQTRVKLGISFGDKTTTPGGDALKFYSSMRIKANVIKKISGADVSPFGYNVKHDDYVGTVAEITTVKNKTVDPFKTAYGVLLFKTGFDLYMSMFYTLKQLKLITPTKAKSGYVFDEPEGKAEFTKRTWKNVYDEDSSRFKKALERYYFQGISENESGEVEDDGE